jgi:outer membrane protein assembly factor BamB
MYLLLFFFALQSFHSSVAADNSTIYPQNPFLTTDAVFVSGTGISRYEISSLEKSWNVLSKIQTFEPIVVGDAVLVGSTDGLYALHQETGKVLWHVAPSTTVFSPVVVGDHVYTGSREGRVRATNLGNGSLVWQKDLEGWIYPPVVQGGTFIAGGSADVLYGLDTENGEVVWTRPLPQELVYRPVAVEGGHVLLTTFSGHLTAIRASSGETVWQAKDPAAGFSPMVTADRVFVGAFDGKLRAHALTDGSLLWEHHIGGQLPYTPRAYGDAVLVASEHGRIAAIDGRSGSLLWHTELVQPITGSPVVVNQQIVVPTAQGRLFTFPETTIAFLQ